MNLRADLRIRLANHRKSVRCLLGFGNLRRLASPFGQGVSSDTSNGVDVQNGTIRNSYRASWMRNSAIHSEKNNNLELKNEYMMQVHIELALNFS